MAAQPDPVPDLPTAWRDGVAFSDAEADVVLRVASLTFLHVGGEGTLLDFVARFAPLVYRAKAGRRSTFAEDVLRCALEAGPAIQQRDIDVALARHHAGEAASGRDLLAIGAWGRSRLNSWRPAVRHGGHPQLLGVTHEAAIDVALRRWNRTVGEWLLGSRPPPTLLDDGTLGRLVREALPRHERPGPATRPKPLLPLESLPAVVEIPSFLWSQRPQSGRGWYSENRMRMFFLLSALAMHLGGQDSLDRLARDASLGGITPTDARRITFAVASLPNNRIRHLGNLVWLGMVAPDGAAERSFPQRIHDEAIALGSPTLFKPVDAAAFQRRAWNGLRARYRSLILGPLLGALYSGAEPFSPVLSGGAEQATVGGQLARRIQRTRWLGAWIAIGVGVGLVLFVAEKDTGDLRAVIVPSGLDHLGAKEKRSVVTRRPREAAPTKTQEIPAARRVSQEGTLKGIVSENDISSGRRLGGLVVELDEGIRTEVTDDRGVFAFYDVPFGVHMVAVSDVSYERGSCSITLSRPESWCSIALTAADLLVDTGKK